MTERDCEFEGETTFCYIQRLMMLSALTSLSRFRSKLCSARVLPPDFRTGLWEGLFRSPREGLSAGFDSLGMCSSLGRRSLARHKEAAARRIVRKALAELRPLAAAPITALASIRKGILR